MTCDVEKAWRALVRSKIMRSPPDSTAQFYRDEHARMIAQERAPAAPVFKLTRKERSRVAELDRILARRRLGHRRRLRAAA